MTSLHSILARLTAGELTPEAARDEIDEYFGGILQADRKRIAEELRRRADLTEHQTPTRHRSQAAQYRIASELREVAKGIERGVVVV